MVQVISVCSKSSREKQANHVLTVSDVDNSHNRRTKTNTLCLTASALFFSWMESAALTSEHRVRIVLTPSRVAKVWIYCPVQRQTRTGNSEGTQDYLSQSRVSGCSCLAGFIDWPSIFFFFPLSRVFSPAFLNAFLYTRGVRTAGRVTGLGQPWGSHYVRLWSSWEGTCINHVSLCRRRQHDCKCTSLLAFSANLLVNQVIIMYSRSSKEGLLGIWELLEGRAWDFFIEIA